MRGGGQNQKAAYRFQEVPIKKELVAIKKKAVKDQ